VQTNKPIVRANKWLLTQNGSGAKLTK